MTPEAQALIAVTDRVGAAFRGLYSWKKDRDEQKRKDTRAALTSLVLAASETRQYLGAVRDGRSPKSPETEKHLSTLWSDAAMDMKAIDPVLANTYLLKADYWSDRIGWTQAQKVEQVIELDEVYRLGREVLLGGG